MYSSIFRVAVVFIPLSAWELFLLIQCFDERKTLWPFICVWLVRATSILPLYAPAGVIPSYMILIAKIGQLILTPLQSACFVWMFYNHKTPIVKILGVGLLWEGIASIIMSISILSVNVLEGYGNAGITEVFRPFQMMDLLTPGFASVLYSLLYFKGQRLFKAVRNYDIKHPVIVGAIIIPLYIYGYITSIDPVTYGYFVFYMMTTSASAIAAIMLSAYMYTINKQRKALRASSQMVNDHYQMLQSRIDELERQQNEINAKMTVLVSANFPEDLTKRYLNDMKHLKDNLYTTLYTHYYTIDAVLSAKAKNYREQQIAFDCQCEGLSLKHLSQVQVSQVLMTLFRYIDQYDNTSIKLKLSSYMNQVIIILDTSNNISISGLKRQITNQLSNKLLSIQKKKQTLYLSIND
ncbi:MAG: hypothetical protein J6P61_08240 [Erysipelotrichaceae bacterium]|nr:hypothetical protein [Erysipelotrichaceae bacterium]